MASIAMRVIKVLVDWCGIAKQDLDQTTSLSEMWVATRHSATRPHDGLDFEHDGVIDLLNKLNNEFVLSSTQRKDTSVFTLNSFKPNGTGDIDTTADLISGVIGCRNLADRGGKS